MKGLVGLYLKRPINICLQSARLISQECGISISNMMSNQNLTIYTSHSKCIYENLAFEEWIFRKHDFEGKGDVVLLWRFIVCIL
jgi:hypothetical protein